MHLNVTKPRRRLYPTWTVRGRKSSARSFSLPLLCCGNGEWQERWKSVVRPPCCGPDGTAEGLAAAVAWQTSGRVGEEAAGRCRQLCRSSRPRRSSGSCSGDLPVHVLCVHASRGEDSTFSRLVTRKAAGGVRPFPVCTGREWLRRSGRNPRWCDGAGTLPERANCFREAFVGARASGERGRSSPATSRLVFGGCERGSHAGWRVS